MTSEGSLSVNGQVFLPMSLLEDEEGGDQRVSVMAMNGTPS